MKIKFADTVILLVAFGLVFNMFCRELRADVGKNGKGDISDAEKYVEKAATATARARVLREQAEKARENNAKDQGDKAREAMAASDEACEAISKVQRELDALERQEDKTKNRYDKVKARFDWLEAEVSVWGLDFLPGLMAFLHRELSDEDKKRIGEEAGKVQEMIDKLDPKTPLQKKIKKDLERQLGDFRSKLTSGLGSLPGGMRDTLAALVQGGKVKMSNYGTGETIGHICNLTLMNMTQTPLTISIPSTVASSKTGNDQDCLTKEMMVFLAPEETRTFPVAGHCLTARRPAVGKNVRDAFVMENPETPGYAVKWAPIVYKARAALKTVPKLRSLGLCKTPYSAKPELESAALEQWGVGSAVARMQGNPIQKSDFEKKVIEIAEKDGPLSKDDRERMQPGIDEIWSCVEMTGTALAAFETSQNGPNIYYQPDYGEVQRLRDSARSMRDSAVKKREAAGTESNSRKRKVLEDDAKEIDEWADSLDRKACDQEVLGKDPAIQKASERERTAAEAQKKALDDYDKARKDWEDANNSGLGTGLGGDAGTKVKEKIKAAEEELIRKTEVARKAEEEWRKANEDKCQAEDTALGKTGDKQPPAGLGSSAKGVEIKIEARTVEIPPGPRNIGEVIKLNDQNQKDIPAKVQPKHPELPSTEIVKLDLQPGQPAIPIQPVNPPVPVQPPGVAIAERMTRPERVVICKFDQWTVERTYQTPFRPKSGRGVSVPTHEDVIIVVWEYDVFNRIKIIGSCPLPKGHAGDHQPVTFVEEKIMTVSQEESYPPGTTHPKSPKAVLPVRQIDPNSILP